MPLLIWRHYKTQKNRQYIQETDKTDKIDIEEKAMNAGILFGGIMAGILASNAIILYPNDPHLLAKAVIEGIIGGGIGGYVVYIFHKKIYKKKLFARNL